MKTTIPEQLDFVIENQMVIMSSLIEFGVPNSKGARIALEGLTNRTVKTVRYLNDVTDNKIENMKLASKLLEEENGPVPKTKSECLQQCKTCHAGPSEYCELKCGPYSIYVQKIAENLKGLTNITSAMKDPFFGKAPCQTCGDELAGDRYEIRADRGVGVGGLVHLDVCVDCYEYLLT